jgi:putative peptide zinc metalloprotease protein
MTPASSGAIRTRLPGLRQDLQLSRGASGPGGEQVWLVYDPVAHRYHELDETGFAILRAWKEGDDAAAVALRAGAASGERITTEQVEGMVRVGEGLGLFVEGEAGWRGLHDRAENNKPAALTWLLHNYLFIRIPLARPQRFLQATLPAVAVLASWPFLAFYAAIGLVGLYLVSRQWDAFVATFINFLSLEGFIGYALAIVTVKTFHELGHAYVAVRYGCRVPTIGVAFMLLMPVLYSDVTDAWRLTKRRQRLAIDAGGIMVEGVIALFALFFWSFLPDGPVRSAAFFVGTGSILASLLVNLNPLMRFDGYYILSDLLRVSNLQARSFDLARWRLKEWLFGLGEQQPDVVGPRLRAGLIAYAYATWLYRLMLFIGIAVLVYVTTFKALGILLFAVEIIWFILLPVWSELRDWWSDRERIMRSKRTLVSVAALAGVLALFLAPWSSIVDVPAVLEPVKAERLAASVPGRIVVVEAQVGQQVRRGDVIVRLDSPRLDSDIGLTRTRIALTALRLSRRAADAADLAETVTLTQQLAAQEERLAGLLRQKEDLAIKAPEDGVVREMAPDLHPGRWLGRREEIALILTGRDWQARGYLSQDSLWRIDLGARATFVPENFLAAKLPAELRDVDRTAATEIDIAYLTSANGGDIAIREDGDRKKVPVVGQYQARFVVPNLIETLPGEIRGTMRLESRRESIFSAVLRKVAVTLVRESGF